MAAAAPKLEIGAAQGGHLVFMRRLGLGGTTRRGIEEAVTATRWSPARTRARKTALTCEAKLSVKQRERSTASARS